MEKGPSEYAEFWTSEFNEVNHFLKHGWQMGFEYDIAGYSNVARELALSNDDNILAFVRMDGCTCKFNKATRHFIVINKNGKIVAFYKADLKYVLKEFEKKGISIIKGDFSNG